jgi:F0F1-type ATP synthase assembly protein I
VEAGPEKSSRESAFFRYAKFAAVAFEFIGSIAAGVFLGSALDAWLRTEPWLVLTMTITGTVVGFYRMVQILRRLERNL